MSINVTVTMMCSYCTGIYGRSQLREVICDSDRKSFDTMMAIGDASTLSLYSTIGISEKGSWNQTKQSELMKGMQRGDLSALQMRDHAEYLHGRRKVSTTHDAYERSIKYWDEFRKIFDLPHTLHPVGRLTRRGAVETILDVYFTHLSLTLKNGNTKVKGEAQGDTIAGHITRLMTAHQNLGIVLPDMKDRIQELATGHDKKLIDVHGVRPKKKATPANTELYKIMMKMDWTGVADKYMVTAFMALFLCLWEGLLRQAASPIIGDSKYEWKRTTQRSYAYKYVQTSSVIDYYVDRNLAE